MSTMSFRQWRAGAVLCTFLVLLIMGLIWPSLHSLWSRRSEIMTARARLTDITDRRRLLASTATPSANLVDPSAAGLLGASTENEAITLLDSYLRSSIQGHGGADVAIRIEAISEQDMPVLRAHVSARLPDRETLKAIHRLETGSPAVIVDRIRLQHFASPISSTEKWISLTGTMRVYLVLFAGTKKRP